MRGLGQRGASVRDRLLRVIDWGMSDELRIFSCIWAIHSASYIPDSICLVSALPFPRPHLPPDRGVCRMQTGSFLSGVVGAAHF